MTRLSVFSRSNTQPSVQTAECLFTLLQLMITGTSLHPVWFAKKLNDSKSFDDKNIAEQFH